MKLKDIYLNKWTRFAFWACLYLAWVIWLGNWWWLFGLIVVFDLNVTKKVNWTFWKPRRKEKRNALTEWIDAIVFAVIVVTFLNIFFLQAFKIPSSSMESSLMTGDHLFVSKLAYGPRVPGTPLTIPFTHNVIFGKESYSTLIRNDYRRLKGFGRVKRYDPVVFGFPDGDTVLTKLPADDYYTLCRIWGREETIRRCGPVIVRPMDKKDHYVKRCVGIPGDTLKIVNGDLYVNGEPAPVFRGQQTSYTVKTKGGNISPRHFVSAGIDPNMVHFDSAVPGYENVNITEEQAEMLRSNGAVASVSPDVDVYPPDYPDSYLTIFPFDGRYEWTRDNFGPLWVPSAGATVELNSGNLSLYRRIIEVYEGHSLSVDGDCIVIDGKPATSYTFGQDYYFMMGDNRHNSLDSRYWGFVPEDHIVGKPRIVWLSTDPSKTFPANIRWKRFLKMNFD